MKPLIAFSLFLLALGHLSLFAQDISLELPLENFRVLDAEPAGNDAFFLLCEKKSAADLMVRNLAKEKAIFKFDANLQQVWPEPLALKGIVGYDATMFSYTDPAGQHSADYFFGSQQFIQVRQDGSVHEKETGISKKEANKTAAVFVDDQGLHILTITGDETFPTGSMNWYTFSHSDLSLTKRPVSLPLPPAVDDDNESGWRLNQVTDDGLFFYYISYKNEVKDLSRTILACHVIAVGRDGKAGKIVTVDPALDKYKALPCSFSQDYYPNLQVFAPKTWQTDTYSSPSSGVSGIIYIPTDNSFMGVKVDGNAGRIYTVAALNEQVEVHKKHGRVETDGRGWAFPVKSFLLTISDLQGQKIATATLAHTPSKLAPTDNYGYQASQIELIPLPGDEGVICKFVNNGKIVVWVVSPEGEIRKEFKTRPYSLKMGMVKTYHDIFSVNGYETLDDLETSPYLARGTSSMGKFFEGLDDKTKWQTFYIHCKMRDMLIVPEAAGNKLMIYSFTKN